MRRGEIYDARLDPTEGSEQAGIRPIIIVSRNAINVSSGNVLAIPCTTYREGRRIYATQVLIQAPEGGLTRNSIALGDQVRVLSKARLLRLRGMLSEDVMTQVDQILLIALDLPGQSEDLTA
jgi:mRNA interferase MazF